MKSNLKGEREQNAKMLMQKARIFITFLMKSNLNYSAQVDCDEF